MKDPTVRLSQLGTPGFLGPIYSHWLPLLEGRNEVPEVQKLGLSLLDGMKSEPGITAYIGVGLGVNVGTHGIHGVPGIITTHLGVWVAQDSGA